MQMRWPRPSFTAVAIERVAGGFRKGRVSYPALAAFRLRRKTPENIDNGRFFTTMCKRRRRKSKMDGPNFQERGELPMSR